MKNPVKDPLDKLFSGLNNMSQERPSLAFVQDLEARLDALDKKRRKPLFAWWIFSALAAVALLSTYFLLLPVRAKSKVPNKLLSALPSTPSPRSTSSISLSSSSSLTIDASSSSAINKASTLSSLLSPTSSTTKTSKTSTISNAAFISIEEQNKTQAPIQPTSANQPSTSTTISILSTENSKGADSTIAMPKIKIVGSEIQMSNLNPKQNKFKSSIGLQFGLSGIFSSFEVPISNPLYTATELKQFRDTREIGERQTSSWDFNLRYGLSIGNWQLQTGLHYFEWGEQLQYEVISVSGTNRYRYLNVPVLVGYNFNLGKVQLLSFAGVAFGKCLSTQGTYIQPQANGVALANAKQIAGTLIGQVELQYALTPQLRVTFTPVYRRTMGALIDNGLVVNRYQSLGLLTGFLFNL